MIRNLALAATCAWLMIAVQRARSDEPAKPAPSGIDGSSLPADQRDMRLERLVEQLGSQDYRAREAATRDLIAAGVSAVEPVLKAAQSDDLEMSLRGVRVLQGLLDSNNHEAQNRALEALESVAGQAGTSAAALAGDVLSMYRLTREDRVVEQLRSLGARVLGYPPDDSPLPWVTLGSQWHGTSADMTLLKQLPSMERLSIFVPLDEGAVATIADLKDIITLDLYGTGVSAEQQTQLKKVLPNTVIDLRQGAKLGIGCDPGGCVIRTVQDPSSAKAADIQQGDIVLSFDGNDVKTFEQLTDLIREKKVGDKVVVRLRRGEQEIDKELSLGKWE